MFSFNDQNLRSRLIGLVGSQPDLRAQELSALFSARSRKNYSIQAIHKQLRQLVYDGIVVREAMKYRLDLSWLSELERFTRIARIGLTTRSSWPIAGKSARLSFPDLEYLLQWMTDAVVTLLQTSRAGSAFEYCPSLWQGLVNVPNERRFWNYVKGSKINYRIVVGSSSALDVAYRKLMPDPSLVSIGNTVDGVGPFSHVMVIGSYIVEILFAPVQLRLMRQIFTNEHHSRAQLLQLASEFKEQRGKIRVKIRNDLRRAEKLRRKFEELF
jgi:hypothetical protein